MVRRSRLFVIAVALTVAGGISLLGGVAWAAPNPPGNNGTIKLDDLPFDDHPNNEPHVGCTFQVDFYGFDQGDLDADVTFEAHPPTLRPGGGSQVLLHDTVFIGEDDNSGGGSEAGLDASKTYTLAFPGITPHRIQGFHVKLTVHAEGSQGADTKYKVFWVRGCESGTTTTTTPGGSSSSSSSSTTTTTTGGSVGGSSSSAGGSAGGEVSSSGGGLAETGAGVAPLLVAGLSLLGLGAATVFGLRSRRA
ncbi:MAG TPA: hypothetical protein VGM21_06620 [Actinomycetota bacterium]